MSPTLSASWSPMLLAMSPGSSFPSMAAIPSPDTWRIGPMPELPEIEALADHLRRHAVGLTIGRIDVSALSVLKTFDPPITALSGQTVTGANRWGKYLGLQAGDLHLITHLSRAGWLRGAEKLPPVPLRPGGKSPIALRVPLGKPGDAPGFDLTEAGTQKR